ncbi:hypothetical protein FRC12_008070 [Ceratobasidium sp. 428]|nr:hypothetical protein FRC12_008070 [Ceratobasidium sp. 428]
MLLKGVNAVERGTAAGKMSNFDTPGLSRAPLAVNCCTSLYPQNTYRHASFTQCTLLPSPVTLMSSDHHPILVVPSSNPASFLVPDLNRALFKLNLKLNGSTF